MKNVNAKHIAYHLIFWIAIMLAFAISEWGYRQTLADAIIFELLYLPARLIAVYVNWFVLIPKYLYKNRWLTYFVSLVLLLATMAILHRAFALYWGYPTFFPEWMTEGPKLWKPSRLLQATLIIVSPVAFTTGFKLFMDWYKEKQETEVLRREKIAAELKFLRSQTNPHFLFNTLNSIYGLALERSEKTPSLILKLSDILSYTLYESNTEKVPLTKELALIENILALEKERYEKRVMIDYKAEGEVDGIEIPPLILVPFIENAFKHGLKNEDKTGWIHIRIKSSASQLLFSIENSIASIVDTNSSGGLGLQNIKRRLELLYGDQKRLTIHETKKSFAVNLTINFPEHVT